MLGNLQSEKIGVDLQQKLDVQYVSAWHRNCLNNCEKNSWTVPDEAVCKLKCDLQASPSDSHKSASIDVSDTLRGIGDNFHALADSVSVL
ncbi:hypothetical protein [Wolbachia endosymbiont (group B) of Athalia cordata]|uniref:hypothetical protein n=1 Tax=Wolbachia endosymbiont (group B) of Athalia cordata TaxID=2953986 RepID=UPI002230BF53|nr:hypothetical protein [Wolbachia endosymbiont (group B) of Athalia cordata]